MRPMKLVLLVVLAPLWLPHYLALMGVGMLIRRSMEWPATPAGNDIPGYSSTTDTPVAPPSSRFKWKLTRPSLLSRPSSAANNGKAVGSQASHAA